MTQINKYTFRNCTNLTNVVIPDSVTSIDEDAFNYCSSVKTVYFEGSLEQWCKIHFASASANPFINSHDAKLYINNELMANVTIPSTITEINGWTFFKCSSLTNIEIPDSVTSIGQNAFAGCSNLTSVEISENVTNIGNFAFSGCTSLTDINIPDSVTSVGQYAFNNCKNLQAITLETTTPPTFGSKMLDGCTSLKAIYVPSESVEAYKTASGWKSYKSKIQPIPTT